MRAQKAIVSFTKVRDSEIANTAQNIVNKMTTNPYFTDPQPLLIIIQEYIAAYSAA